MSFYPEVLKRAICALIFLGGSVMAQNRFAVNIAWLPVTEAEKAQKEPLVEKGAGAEIVFWRIHVLDDMRGQDVQRVLNHYVRMKVFNDKGKEQVSTIDIEYGDRNSVGSVSGRTIKADGTIVELSSDAVHKRELLKTGGLKRSAVSFAMPGVEPGAIVEYRWKEIRNDNNLLYMRLHMQREFPVQKVTYFLQPLSADYTSYKMSVRPFNCRPSPVKQENDGWQSISLENVPAFKEEPMMPGEGSVRPWVLAFYRQDDKRVPDKYWEKTGKETFKVMKLAMNATKEIKEAVASATAGADTEEKKVLGLIAYLRQHIRGLWSAKVTEAERARLIKQLPKDRLRNSGEVFKSGIAMPNELNTLFATMALQAGLEARPAFVADREDIVFSPEMADSYFLPNIDMAVQIGGQWRLYDVSARHLPAGMLGWREEGMQALVCDSKSPEFVESKISTAEASRTERKATLKLGADGSLEGDVVEAYTGHSANLLRQAFDVPEAEKQKEQLQERVRSTFAGAELKDLAVENAADPEKPLLLKYHLRVENYAQRTGKRLLFQPLFFQFGSKPMFPASERRHNVVFPFAWEEEDTFSIDLPAGFALDHGETAQPVPFGDVGGYEVKMALAGGKQLQVTRKLVMGRNGKIVMPQRIYAAVKGAFDAVNAGDTLSMSLKAAQ